MCDASERPRMKQSNSREAGMRRSSPRASLRAATEEGSPEDEASLRTPRNRMGVQQGAGPAIVSSSQTPARPTDSYNGHKLDQAIDY